MKRTAILIAALAGLLLTAQAQAQAPGKGAYLGIGYGTVWTDGASLYTNTRDDDTAAGARVYGGYMWNDRWGMEIGYHALGTYDVDFAGAKIAEAKTSAISVAGVFTTPLFETGYNFNFRLGLAFTNAEHSCVSICGIGDPPNVDTKKRGTSGTIGIGIGAKLSESFSMRVDYDHFGSVHQAVDTVEFKDGYDVLSVNLQLRF